MERVWRFFVHEWVKVVIPLGIFLLCIALGLVIRRILFRAFRRWAARTRSHLDQILIDSLRGPIVIWSIILGIDLATRSSVLPLRYVRQTDLALLALWIISLTIMGANLAGDLVRFWGARVSGETAGTATLSRNLAQIVVVSIGLLILLNHLGVDIRPLLTALGVGGLAVALALQDTMSNLFAGFYISVAGQIRIGDYIKLNSGEEGYVADITWRSTTLRALGSNFIFIPNNKLGQAIVTNFNMPGKEIGTSLTVRVGYDCDLDRVEAVLLEEANRALAEVKGLAPDSPPNITLIPGFTDSALVLSLNYQIAEFVDQFGVSSELRRRILKRFQKEGIAMALPAQRVEISATPAWPGQSETDPPHRQET